MQILTQSQVGERPARTQHPMGMFSKLPPEVRNQIFEYVLTGHNIHIDCRFLNNAVVHPSERMNVYMVNGQPWGISARLCSATTSESEAYDQTKLSKRDESSVMHYEDRHATCLRPSRGADRHKPPIALLKTCRQIYTEAVGYLYADNIFSFKCAEDMDLFISIALNHSQRLWIRHLRLHCETTRHPNPFGALAKGMVESLANLRSFGLTIAEYYKSFGVPELPKIPTKRLESVEVVVGPKPFHTKGTKTEAWRNRYHAEEFERRLWRRESVERYDPQRACLVTER